MMILVGILKDSGVFGCLAIKSAQAAQERPVLVLVYLAFMTAVPSAFFDNVTAVFLMFSVTMVITRILEEDPIPYLQALRELSIALVAYDQMLTPSSTWLTVLQMQFRMLTLERVW